MPEISFDVADYSILSISFQDPKRSAISILEMRSAPVTGHGTLKFQLRITTAPWITSFKGSLKHAFEGSTFNYEFAQPVSRTLFDHVHQVCIHERPVTLELGYGGDEILPFTSPDNERGTTERDMHFFRLKTGREPVGEGLEDVRRLIEQASR